MKLAVTDKDGMTVNGETEVNTQKIRNNKKLCHHHANKTSVLSMKSFPLIPHLIEGSMEVL